MYSAIKHWDSTSEILLNSRPETAHFLHPNHNKLATTGQILEITRLMLRKCHKLQCFVQDILRINSINMNNILLYTNIFNYTG